MPTPKGISRKLDYKAVLLSNHRPVISNPAISLIRPGKPEAHVRLDVLTKVKAPSAEKGKLEEDEEYWWKDPYQIILLEKS